jgi:hypothetical protein
MNDEVFDPWTLYAAAEFAEGRQRSLGPAAECMGDGDRGHARCGLHSTMLQGSDEKLIVYGCEMQSVAMADFALHSQIGVTCKYMPLLNKR